MGKDQFIKLLKDSPKLLKKINESLTESFKKGDKVKYLGHPAVITHVEDRMGKTYYSVSYNKGTGKTKARMILSTDGSITEAKVNESLTESLNEAEVDVKQIIKTLGDTDFGGSNDEQAKAVQLLKGLVFSDDPMANKFMKMFSDVSTKIADKLLGSEESPKESPKEAPKEVAKESATSHASAILDALPNEKVNVDEARTTPKSQLSPATSTAADILG